MELGDVLPSFLFLSNEKTHDTRLQFLTFLPQVSEAAHRTLYYPRDMHIPVQRKYLLSPKSCTLVPVTGWTTLHLLRVVRVAQRYIFRNGKTFSWLSMTTAFQPLSKIVTVVQYQWSEIHKKQWGERYEFSSNTRQLHLIYGLKIPPRLRREDQSRYRAR